MEESPYSEGRPGFLTALCVLSFIGIGLMLVLSLLGVKQAFTTPTPEELLMVEQSMQMMEAYSGDDSGALTQTILDSMNDPFKAVNWLLGFVGNLLSLFGVIQMWKLKKTGFFIYSAAELIPPTITFALSGTAPLKAMLTMFGMSGMVTGIIVMFYALDLLFIGLYAMNLKKMN